MKFYEIKSIAEKNHKSLVLANCSYICFAGGRIRRVKQEGVGAWGWCLYPHDGYMVALSDINHESNDVEWRIDSDNISDVEIDADCITIKRDDIIVKYVELPVNEPMTIATSFDGKASVETCYGDGYIVHKVNGDTAWYTCEEEAVGYIEDYEDNQD